VSAPRRLAVVLVGASILAGSFVTIAYFYLQLSIQRRTGEQRIPGLASQVEIGFDDWAIPSIEAESDPDLFRAQGYVHASERLWQLELFQRIARGRLAEIFGESAVDADILIRTLDLWGAAGVTVEAMDPADVALLQAYAEGVNARIDTWRGPWPPEFLVLGIEPESWSVRASLAIGKIMSLDLSGWGTELSRIDALARLPESRRGLVRPSYPDWGPTILQDPAAELRPVGVGPGLSVETRTRPDASQHAVVVGGGPAPTGGRTASKRRDPIRFLATFGLHASNSWAVGGSRTADGAPLLANDMHLSLRAPSTWYLNVLHGGPGGIHAAGLSIPGAPGVVVGLNRGVAWGFTNAMLDDADFVVESVNLDASMYFADSEWRAFERREETIRVRGRPELVTHTVRSTRRGPVITDVVPSGGLTLSLLWTPAGADGAADGLLAMNRAETAEAFRDALERFRSPHQNVIYATTGGELGYRLAGSVPLRGSADAGAPIPFQDLPFGWTGRWPADSMPELRAPVSDFLASANNLQARALFGRIGVDYPLPFRARRIVDRVSAAGDWTVDDMRRLQLDTYSLWAERLLPRAIAAARRIGATAVASALEGWDRTVTTASPEAGWFHVWLYRLRELIATDELDDGGWFPDTALDSILAAGDDGWVDDIRTPVRETLEGLEDEAMRTAVRVVRGRAWGEIHGERSAHTLGALAWLDRILRLNIGPYPSPGGRHTVRPDDPERWAPLDSTSWAPPFVGEYGPSERFVAHLVEGDPIGHFLLPTGQSGNPLDPHYRDMSRHWIEAELVPIGLDPTRRRTRESSRLRLVPIGEGRAPGSARSR